MKTHIVNSSNQHLYISELDRFFSIRHDIYVHEKKWREADESGLEIDQYDTNKATYLIAMQDDEIVVGSRLLPFTQPTMLGEHFSDLCNHISVPTKANVAEWTRGFVAPKFREKGIGIIKSRFCADVMEFCLREKIERIGGIQEIYWLRMWQALGWQTHLYGDVKRVAGRRCAAVFKEVSTTARDNALHYAGSSATRLVYEGPYKPFIPAHAPAEHEHAA